MKTVRQLIEELQTFDPDLPVVVMGYEGGYDDCCALVKVAIKKNPMPGYCGDYDDVQCWEKDVEHFEAVLIPRN